MVRNHCTVDRIISDAFPTRWPLHSPDSNPYDFVLWDYLKDKVYRGHVGNVANLKNQILVRIIGPHQLHASVDHAVTQIHVFVLKQVDTLKPTCDIFVFCCVSMNVSFIYAVEKCNNKGNY